MKAIVTFGEIMGRIASPGLIHGLLKTNKCIEIRYADY